LLFLDDRSEHSSPGAGGVPRCNPQHASSEAENTIDWVVIVLDQRTLNTHIFPDLTRRYFAPAAAFDYQVAVVGGNEESKSSSRPIRRCSKQQLRPKGN